MLTVHDQELSRPQWVCVRSEPRREFLAEANLKRAEFEVYLPRYERIISHARKRVPVLRPLFPNYIFVRSARGMFGLGDVKRTPGVSTLAVRDLQSATVPDAIISGLREREDEHGKILFGVDRFHPGDPVRLSRGPFAEIDAVFAERRDDRRCRILLNMLGKQHYVTVLSEFLEKVA